MYCKLSPFEETKNLAQGEVSNKIIGHSHETAKTSFSKNVSVKTSEVFMGKSSEPQNNFQTSENPHPISRFGASNPKSRDLLPG